MRVSNLPFQFQRIVFPMGAGLMGALLLMGVYLGIVSLAESPKHALSLFWEDKIFVIPIMIGFGIQVGLYTFLKTGAHLPASGAATATSGGMSTVAMVACCVHHVADVMPILGLTAAATFLANWKIPFMIVGLISNALGIAVMLRTIYKERQRALIGMMALESTP